MPEDTRVTGFQPQPIIDNEQTDSLVTRGGSSDAALLRVSVEIARQYPRDEQRIMQKLKNTLDAYPQFAETALYSIPYQDRRSGRTVRVEGLSIRAAETLRNAWGHMRTGVRILSEDDDGWNLEAVCFDMEANVWELAPSRAVKWEKTREGRVVMLDERRQLQARGAAVSKVKRNAILAVLPLHIKAAFELWCREKMAGGDLSRPANPGLVTAALAAFATEFQVSPEKLERYIGKPKNLWVGADLAELKTIINTLRDGETTVQEAFGEQEPVIEAPPPQGTVVDARDGQLGAQREPTPPTPPPAPPEPEPVPAAAPPRPPVAEAATTRRPVTSVEQLLNEVTTAATIEQLDALLGRLYAPGAKITREEKRAALTQISARRDVLQAQARG